jgi:hypothetical protein
MKPTRFSSWVLGLAITSIAASGALAQEQAVAPGAKSSGPTVALAAKSPTDVAKPLPTNGFNSAWFLELAKLARSGIDENVMLAFVNNTDGTFNLGPEQIIYLKSLGTSSRVINTAMVHDRLMKTGWIPLLATTTPDSGTTLGRAGTAASSGTTQTPSGDQPATTLAAGGPTDLAVPADSDSIVVRQPEPFWPALFDESDLAPEQPDNVHVRLPYPVRLTDPIIMLEVPCL